MDTLKRILEGTNRIGLWLLFWVIVGTVGYAIYKGAYPETPARVPYVARIDITGDVIPGLTDFLKPRVEEAYNDPNAKAVVFHIDSTGGALSEAWRFCVYLESVKAKEKARAEASGQEPRLTYTTVGYFGTSAAFYIALCAGNVHAAPASHVGSIGSMMTYDEAEMKKVKYIASGTGKVLDYTNKEGRALAQELVNEVATEFLSYVMGYREGKLKMKHSELASGRMWTGKRAYDLGLIDGLSTPEGVADHLKLPLLFTGYVEPTFWEKFKDALSVLRPLPK